jgi:hypothetical protein
MSPITHFLASWAIAEGCTQDRRERQWICIAGLAPDLDGLGLAVDITNDLFGRGVSQWYAVYHHFLFHGLFGALVMLGMARLAGVRRWRGWLLVFFSFHMHLLCDLVGARGPEKYDIWVIYYLGPFTRMWPFSWSHQWPLNGWPNFLISIGLLGWTVTRAIQRGASPVSLFSRRWDELTVAALRQRWNGRSRPDIAGAR